MSPTLLLLGLSLALMVAIAWLYIRDAGRACENLVDLAGRRR